MMPKMVTMMGFCSHHACRTSKAEDGAALLARRIWEVEVVVLSGVTMLMKMPYHSHLESIRSKAASIDLALVRSTDRRKISCGAQAITIKPILRP